MTLSTALAGRTVMVTGAGSGIGTAIAMELGRSGAHVLGQDLRPEAARDVAEQIQAVGGSAGFVGGDVSEPGYVTAIVEARLQSHQRVDILVNNAGRQHVAPLDQFPLAQWNRRS